MRNPDNNDEGMIGNERISNFPQRAPKLSNVEQNSDHIDGSLVLDLS